MSPELPSLPPHPHRLNIPYRFISRRPAHNSLAKRAIKLVCSVFLSLLLAACVLIFILWLALRPHRPRFHVSSFSAAGLPDPASGLTFSYQVEVRNPNGEIAIFYDSVFGSVYYGTERVGFGAAPASGPFFQPAKNTTVISGEVTGAARVPAAGEIARDAKNGSVGFRLELTSVIRFRLTTWDTHRHHLHVSCDVAVGSDELITVGSKDKRCSLYFL